MQQATAASPDGRQHVRRQRAVVRHSPEPGRRIRMPATAGGARCDEACARPGAEGPARCQPAGRRRDPVAGRQGPRRRLAPRRGNPPRRDRRAVEARPRRRARRDGHRHPRAVQPHRPHRPLRRSSIAAGVSRVVYAVADPGTDSAGGGERLRAAGVEVEPGVLADEATAFLSSWLTVQRLGRPHVTVKWAQSLDGRAAASDGTSQWITGPAARADVHRRRADADAIVAGTGTVLADDPALTARGADGSLLDAPARARRHRRDADAGRRGAAPPSPTPALLRARTTSPRCSRIFGGAASIGSSSKADPRSRAPSSGPASRMSCSPTSHRCCSAATGSRWPTSASPRSVRRGG